MSEENKQPEVEKTTDSDSVATDQVKESPITENKSQNETLDGVKDIDSKKWLYAFYAKHNGENRKFYISEKNMIDLIQHFYNDIIIEDHKFVHQISCKLWNKKNDKCV
jgi:hypothetical protein